MYILSSSIQRLLHYRAGKKQKRTALQLLALSGVMRNSVVQEEPFTERTSSERSTGRLRNTMRLHEPLCTDLIRRPMIMKLLILMIEREPDEERGSALVSLRTRQINARKLYGNSDSTYFSAMRRGV